MDIVECCVGIFAGSLLRGSGLAAAPCGADREKHFAAGKISPAKVPANAGRGNKGRRDSGGLHSPVQPAVVRRNPAAGVSYFVLALVCAAHVLVVSDSGSTLSGAGEPESVSVSGGWRFVRCQNAAFLSGRTGNVTAFC